MTRARYLFLLLPALSAVLAGCSSAPTRQDPLEPVNRAVFRFNEKADQYVLKPVAQGYKAVVPTPVRTSVSSFFGNLGDMVNFVNHVLQGRVTYATDDFGRVVLNTTLGIAGLIDVASARPIAKHDTDFGVTFGVWGIGPGPYLVLPILGSSSVRDGVGTLAYYYADPLDQVSDPGWYYGLYALRLIDFRTRLLGTEGLVEEAALDKYNFLRSAYFQRRRSLIYDGKPPPEKDSDE